MQVAFDAKRAFLNNSGLGNYSRTLIRSIQKNYSDTRLTLYTPETVPSEFFEYVSDKKNITIQTPQSFIDKKLRSRWRSYQITHSLKEHQFEVYHGLSNELPFNISEFKGKKIVTVHDLIFLRHPELYPYLDRRIYNKKCRHACDSADLIIAISEETKRDIEEFYFIPENKIKVLYQGCAPEFFQNYSDENKAAVLAKYKLPSEYLLYVGTVEERKNLLTIVKALQKVKDIPLVVIGKKKSYFEKVKSYISKNGLEERVIFPENIKNEDLPIVYQMASVFILPSLFEGFGIPILEALCSKTPVITSKGGCFPEAGGPDSIYVDPFNENEIADNINALLDSKSLHSAIAEKGFAFAQKFHPDKVAAQLMQLYRK